MSHAKPFPVDEPAGQSGIAWAGIPAVLGLSGAGFPALLSEGCAASVEVSMATTVGKAVSLLGYVSLGILT